MIVDARLHAFRPAAVRRRAVDEPAPAGRDAPVEEHVAVTPGTTFGPHGAGWIRMSLATATEDLLEGLERIIRCR
ncbi:hypothetical protein ACQP1W_42375 [Spirillospora sp. CA-255316]